MKVLAAILVMFSHYCSIKATNSSSLNAIEWLIRSQGGNIGVAIFFFLSGYGLMMSELKRHLTFTEYVRRRFLKVYLPVVCVTALWLPLAYHINATETGGSIAQIIGGLMVGFEDPVLWFIKSLIILYAAFYLFSFLLTEGKIKKAFLLLWTLTVITCLINYFSNGSFGLSSMSGIPLFSVGVMSAYYGNRFYKRFSIAFIPLVVSLMLLTLVFTFHPRFLANMVHSIADYAVVATILLVFSRFRPNVKIPAICAAVTFDIYLVHYKVLTVISESDMELSLWLFIASTAAASIGFYTLRTKLLNL